MYRVGDIVEFWLDGKIMRGTVWEVRTFTYVISCYGSLIEVKREFVVQ